MGPGGLAGAGPSRVQCYIPVDAEHTLLINMRAGAAGARLREMERLRSDPNTSDAYRRNLEALTTQTFGARTRPLLPNTSSWHGRFRTNATLDNDFLIDRDLQRKNEGANG